MDVLATLAAAYVPGSPAALLGSGAVVALSLLAAFGVSRLRSPAVARLAGWAVTGAAFLAAQAVTRETPAGFRMLVIIGAVLFALKGLVAAEERLRTGLLLAPGAWWSWAALWPGMRPGLFARRATPSDRAGGRALLALGARRLLLGMALVLLARLAWQLTGSKLLATALVLPGLSLGLHFGLFNLGAGLWRLRGHETGPLFVAPLRSTSLTEFWGRRWNLAFTELAQRAVYRPLSEVTGRRLATMAAFLFSALLHELAISVPVGAGYGLPLAYFALHGGLVVMEKAVGWPGSRAGSSPWPGRVYTTLALLLPLPLLFHPPFLRGVVWPLLGIGG